MARKKVLTKRNDKPKRIPIAGKETSSGEKRYCTACDTTIEYGEPDACLGYLPNVYAACCGHGKTRGYIALGDAIKNPVVVRFNKISMVERDKTIRVIDDPDDEPGLYKVKLVPRKLWSKWQVVELEKIDD